jgi:Cdc6-like AAA superfamily ATPase
MFGPAIDRMTEDRKLAGILKQIEAFMPDDIIKEYAKNILLMMGGFDFNQPHAVIDKFRLLSSSLKSLDFDGSVTSSGQSSWPNSHFSDNTYFFHFMKFAQECSSDEGFESNIALVYPKDNQEKGRISGKLLVGTIQEVNLDDERDAQRGKLLQRFPLKFLWMWANKDKVLHPLSLMAFRNFVSSKFMENILNEQNPKLTPVDLTNMKFSDFKETWGKIGDAVMKKLGFEEQSCDLETVSKLISILMVEESDMKNSSDLLKTSKQIILYGAPGTGKTYTAMKIAKEFMTCSEAENVIYQEDAFENEHQFSKLCASSTDNNNDNVYSNIKKGLYEIIQFHPNYTYQDFIGGISPGLDNRALSYELKEGIFQRFCKIAKVNLGCNFVLIIDEINRVNLSEVFGELLYALEYRDKAVNIPYFGEFVIPSNVYIIGTMNDVDKSLVTFDLALRRRFGFFRLDPELDSLNDMFAIDESTCLIEENALLQYIEKCKILNIKLIDQKGLALDLSYQIGQAYFKKIENFLTEKVANQLISPFELEKLWIYHIEPLLQEYLGMSLESGEIKRKLEEIKKEFIKENK